MKRKVNEMNVFSLKKQGNYLILVKKRIINYRLVNFKKNFNNDFFFVNLILMLNFFPIPF